MLVETLITKAAKRAGSQKNLAEMLGVSETVVSGWKSGKRKIQPEDVAAVAHIAGYNATNFLALATLNQAKGTPKEKVLQEALGESIKQLESMLLDGSRTNSPEIQCILCLIDKTGVCTRRSSDSNTPVFEPLRTA